MNVETLSQLFIYNTTKFNKPDLLSYRGKDGNFHKISSNEFKDRVTFFAMGLKGLGVKKDTKVLFLSENRPEWHISDFACHLLGAVVIPIFPTLVPGQIEYIVNHSEAEIIIASNSKQLEKIDKIKDKIKKVKNIILFENEVPGGVLTFDDVLENGREMDSSTFLEDAIKQTSPDKLATIIYTSGTTGTPKGVMLSHRNLIANMLDCSNVLNLTADEKALSFLPLSHAFERTVDYVYFYKGLSIVYSASTENLAKDLEESSPSIMASVPRFYEKVKAKIIMKAEKETGLKKAIFDWALATGKKKSQLVLNDKKPGLFLRWQLNLADNLVFTKIREKTGGSIRFFISGGAPLSADVGSFFHAVGLTILEGYGLTETAPVIAVNGPGKPKFGTVGKILPSVEVKIADDGEILAKGPTIMQGYFKLPKETEEVMSDDWFHTGDIGLIDQEGYLVITDRKKQLLVTSIGKKIAPQAIEKEVEISKYIEQVVLIGEQRSYITALILPDFEQLHLYAQENNIDFTSNENLIRAHSINELIQNEVEARQSQFSNYQRIRHFSLLSEPFTIENGQLTPTMKVIRTVVIEKYAEIIEDMYEGKEELN